MRELVTQREDRQDAGAIARGGQDYPTKASVMRLVGILGYASRPEPVRGNVAGGTMRRTTGFGNEECKPFPALCATPRRES